MIASEGPRQADLDKCVHCGLCLNACPTYRELRVEMDSPRGRIYQMVQVAGGAPISESYQDHIDLCLACRACETACPSGVQYGRLVEAARAQIEQTIRRPLGDSSIAIPGVRAHPAQSRRVAIRRIWNAPSTGHRPEIRRKTWASSRRLRRKWNRRRSSRNSAACFPLSANASIASRFSPDCIANVCFARLNEATVRVLQENGCEVSIPADQTCCGALHVHSGLRDLARSLARRNIDAFLNGGFDAIITNAAGCGSTLKEYGDLLEGDRRAEQFAGLVKDVNEFLASIDLNPRLGEVRATVTYQDSCHLAHGQKIRSAPRQLLARVPGLTLKEMRTPDACCGSAGIYNVLHTNLSMALLEKKMAAIQATGADRIVTANPGCMLQLRVGADRWGRGQRVSHVVEILDEAYRLRNNA